MKKFLVILLVLAMMFSMGVTAFADQEADPETPVTPPTTGSVTITNATVGETYKIYKIFDASFTAGSTGVSYSIKADNQFFAALFGADGTTANTYFVYNANTGSVTKKENVNDSELINYLTTLVSNGTYVTAKEPVVAVADVAGTTEVDESNVVFSDLPYGYYVITSSLGTAVTINSNTPDVSVIDKNQKPGNGFDKQIATSRDAEGNPTAWGDANTANIGDQLTYKIKFQATNYDGDKLIKYYRIIDEKGDAIWADFESFEVYVGGVKLERGYYLAQGGNNTDRWEYLGDWTGTALNANNAQWYLVHTGDDTFRITIPWLEGHTLTIDTNTNAYSLSFPENAVSKFDSPANVEVIYNAVVEANAAIGATTHGNRFNKAYTSWTSEHETGSTTPEEVVTYVHGIGLLKDDIATGKNLAGAKFRIYRDAGCTQPVYVIPTDVDGVYVVDSLNTPLDNVSGTRKNTTRELFEDYLEGYLNGATQDNYVVSQVNGKLAVIGLKAGTYYLKEVEAPSGYNALTQPVEIKAGENIAPFVIFADANGNVADIQQTDGVHTEHRLDLTSTVVHNSKGVVLPSTGGQGTMILIGIGTLLAIGFAVFMITQKKMSVYND